MEDHKPLLSFNTRKALCLHLGESAGKALAEALEEISQRLDRVERDKVDVIRLFPSPDLPLDEAA